MSKVVDTQKKRRKLSKVSVATSKSTRKIIVGWKNRQRTVFKLVPLSSGGGTHSIDVQKAASLSDLEATLADIFFPNGFAPIMELRYSNCVHFLASFQGQVIMPEEFPLERYMKSHSSPVRVYLHTEPVSAFF